MLSLHREVKDATNISIPELLESTVDLIETTLAKGKRQFSVTHGYKRTVEANASGVRQVLTNLLKNAVEATEPGGLIEVASISVMENSVEGVRIEVRDNGVGIPKELYNRLFTPFSSSKGAGGNGLGLWVSRSIVERHGGTLRIEDNPSSRGVTASVFLPTMLDRKN